MEAVDGYREGAVILVTGCADGYSLKGSKEYTCILNTEGQVQWSSEVNTECAGQYSPSCSSTLADAVHTCALLKCAMHQTEVEDNT